MSKVIQVDDEKTDAQYISEMTGSERFTLLVNCEVESLPFFYRRCRTIPTEDQSQLVAALSGGQEGKRSFSGLRTSSCDRYYYLGWNGTGFHFDNRARYCNCCGYALDTIAFAERVIASASLSESYMVKLKFMCDKNGIPLERQQEAEKS